MTVASNNIWKAFLKQDKNAFILDARKPELRISTSFKNSLAIDSLDFESVSKLISSLDKTAHYYLFCSDGSRSEKLFRIMINSGFHQIIKLKGGLKERK